MGLSFCSRGKRGLTLVLVSGLMVFGLWGNAHWDRAGAAESAPAPEFLNADPNSTSAGHERWRSGSDPLGKQLEIGRANFQLLSAAVRQGKRWLHEHQATGRFDTIHGSSMTIPRPAAMFFARIM